MKKTYTIIIKGKNRTWAFDADIDPRHIPDLLEDGLRVEEIVYSGPNWVLDLGLIKVWCFFQDIYNFRNPFRK